MRSVFLALALVSGLTACGGADNVWASDTAVRQAAYRADAPPTLTLFTVISNRTGSGAHSALMINGHERVLFDPAGTWGHERIPERHDVHYGITPGVEDFYIDYHARITYHVIRQDIVVSPEVAELAIRLVEQNGAVPKAHCTRSVSAIVQRLPGFEDAPTPWNPKKFSDYFATKPGVQQDIIYDDDPHLNYEILVNGLPLGA
ncbi:hypothetical protein XMM379_000864 [Aliiroseovarius sp. xm-m-379]|uniref:hypothetical protein n=1 Tax=unclassified Aliiroseovarius TaxID=2623558 RepID=UPI001569BB13|nr:MULTISPECIES: hypothetical protein [unclassified Aliiroseovarius]NRP12981.1 hypothetical protein [Aliiroseovarius sp. xm-d-517]NRP24184.1 hypothetical protein [Aliiroseovarius sp. xm-m-379]NRP30003.1 hypothetical protein [Aliiroseovarius sp. xm-m-314]NRP32983.1 hypothetical protein [Aliiroseovarius sp. xm-a-104]NRP40014.1 hypothetical protein [Aliiroseovarius sp. xm-m-339-2]